MAVAVTITHHNDTPETIWNRLAARLSRDPTNRECRDEIRRILCEARNKP